MESMKKLLLVLFLFLVSTSVFAFEYNVNNVGKYEELVVRTGFKILNDNRIPYRMYFYLDRKTTVANAGTSIRDRKIVLYKGMLGYLDNEDELAAVLAHEIAHGIDSNQGIFRGYFSYIPMSIQTKKYEYKADKRAVDLLIKAGYNPLALITAGSKLYSQPRYDWCSTHPLGSRRLMTIYEYIYSKYPEYLIDNKYKDNVYYQNFLITSRENRKKLEKKINSNSKGTLNYL